MAISLVNSTNGVNSTTNQTTYTTSNYTPASNGNVLAVCIHGLKDAAPDALSFSAVTWGGVDVSANQEVIVIDSTAWAAIYVITSPGTTAQTFSYTVTNTQRSGVIDITEWSGVDTTNPVTSTDTDITAGTGPSVLSFTTSDNGAVVIGNSTIRGGARAPFTPESGTTEITDGQTSGGTDFNDITWSSYYAVDAVAGAITIGTTWAVSTAVAAHVGVELKPAAGGAAAFIPKIIMM